VADLPLRDLLAALGHSTASHVERELRAPILIVLRGAGWLRQNHQFFHQKMK
jgi:hypothetical protein